MTVYKSKYPDAPVLPQRSIVPMFFESPDIQRNYDKKAYIDPYTEKSLTFREFESLVYRYAHYLKSKHGIQKDDVVVLSTVNSIYLPVIHFAVLALGGIVSPANIVYQSDEIAHQLKVVNAKLIVFSDFNEKNITQACASVNHQVDLVKLSEVQKLLEELAGGNSPKVEAVNVDPYEQHAYYVFSSGTSGLPKGVILPQSNLLCQAMSQPLTKPVHLLVTDVACAVLPFSHIFGLTSYIWILPYMARTSIVWPKFEFESLLQGIVKYHIKTVNVVPPMALLFAKSPLVDKYPEVTEILEGIKVGAAPISGSTMGLLKQRYPKLEVAQGYGMTETTSASHVVGLDLDELYDVASVGWVMPSHEMRIVDPVTLKDCPQGVDGEVWIRGPLIMKGYLNNPQATAETIMPGGWLRTGDVGHVDQNEQLFLVDRIKELIKSKGHQVAPAELEGILLQHPDVIDCAVIGVMDTEGVTELPRAYVKLSATGDLREVASWFNTRVSRHKRLWGGIVEIDSIPKSNSGKILRRELRLRKDDKPLFQEAARI